MTIANNNNTGGSGKAQMTLGHHVRRRTAIVSRWLHLYLSLFSFTVVLFFAATGLTLNHPDWFAGQVRTAQHEGSLPAAMLGDKLAVAEALRKTWKLQGSVSDFRVEDADYGVVPRAGVCGGCVYRQAGRQVPGDGDA